MTEMTQVEQDTGVRDPNAPAPEVTGSASGRRDVHGPAVRMKILR